MANRILIWFFCLTTFLFFFPLVANASDNLLSNSDFEDWDSSGPVNWQKSASTGFSAEASSSLGTVKTGSLSALLKLTTSNYRYIYQSAPVSGSTVYRFSGSIKSIFGTASALLRLAWYCSGCTRQLSTDDSSSIDQSTSDFTDLSVEVTSPANAARVKARVVITPTSGSTDTRVLVDNLFLGVVSNSNQNTTTANPIINWNVGSAYDLGETFSIALKLENFDSNKDYYLKFRAGTDESTLNKGQTQNGGAFYADNESWNKFPQITTDGSGKWEGQIFARIGKDKPAGQYTVKIRVRKKDSETFYDSEAKNISLSSPPVVEETVSQTGSVAGKTTAIAVNTADNINFVLGTASAATATPIIQRPANDALEKSPSYKNSFWPIAALLVILGAGLSAAALLAKFKIWEKWPIKV